MLDLQEGAKQIRLLPSWNFQPRKVDRYFKNSYKCTITHFNKSYEGKEQDARRINITGD